MRALIVDDSRFVRGFLRGMLEEKGIECEEAGDGQAGLDRLARRFELRPGARGLEHAGNERPGDAEVHARRGFRRRESDDGDHRGETTSSSCARSTPGADEYLMKPFDDEALDDKLAMLGVVEA